MMVFLSTAIMQTVDPIAASASPWERYGIIGFVAFSSIAALGWVLRAYAAEKTAEAKRATEDRIALQTSLAALNKQMVEMVQTAHQETLELIDQQRDDHEKRFQALLERHIAMTEKWAERTQEIAATVAKTLDSLSRKLRDGG